MLASTKQINAEGTADSRIVKRWSQSHACLVINPIEDDNSLLSSLIASPWIGRKNSLWSRRKAIQFSWTGPELFRLLLGPPGLNWFTSHGSPTVTQHCHVESVLFASS